MPETIGGRAASPGTAAGPVAVLAPPAELPADRPVVTDADAEVSLAEKALAEVADELDARAAKANGDAAEILETQSMMARDPGLLPGVRSAVDGGEPAPWALRTAFDGYLSALEAAGGYLAERTTDLADIRDRAVSAALGVPPPGLPVRDEPYVLVAKDLAPADTATLDPASVLAIVTEFGGTTSHTAILARSLGIPAVVGAAGAAELRDGQRVAVDGDTGRVLLDPDQATVDGLRERTEERARAAAAHSGPGRTADGHPVKLLLNIGEARTSDTEADAEGVGLFRTEFLFLDRTEAPTVAEQREVYQRVFDGFGDRRVVVRTLDAGADKPLPFANSDVEPNPALGVRGYRIATRAPELLDGQLEAIAAAARASSARVRVMAPMIATPAEAAAFAERARTHGIDDVGVMIEVPAAALAADRILSEVDFVSIGTNDLSQYTFAADRMIGELGDLLDAWQPALLELIARTATAAQAAGKDAGVCGEAASDPLLAPVLVGLGITSLSMSAPAVAGVRAALAGVTHAACVDLAHRVRSADDAAAARRIAGDT